MGLTGFGMVFSFLFHCNAFVRSWHCCAVRGRGGGPKMQFPGVFCVFVGPAQIASSSFVPVLTSRTGRVHLKAIIKCLHRSGNYIYH
jgi:hypothetical protein